MEAEPALLHPNTSHGSCWFGPYQASLSHDSPSIHHLELEGTSVSTHHSQTTTNPHCSSNQVKIRTMPLLKSCYASCRSCFHEYNELWIVKYCWVLREKYWFEVGWSNIILLDSPILAWIRIIECWIVNVHAETSTLICRLSISVNFVLELEIFGRTMMKRVWNPNFPTQNRVLIFRIHFAWAFRVSWPWSQSRLDTPLSETRRFT